MAQLLGAADADLARDDLFAGWRLLFERLTETHPVVMVIDDLQWADAGLLDFLDSILDWSSAHPIFILTLARPELAERRPGWGQRRNGTSIGLEPLDGRRWSGCSTTWSTSPPTGRAHRWASRGHPPLRRRDRPLARRPRPVQADGLGPRLVGSLDDLEVPPTLTALLVARLDGLLRRSARWCATSRCSAPASPASRSTRSLDRRELSSTISSPASCAGRS